MKPQRPTRFTLLSGGRIVDPATGRDEVGDLLLERDRIVSLGRIPSPPREDVETLSVDGLVVAPGLIDMHVHLREPGNAEEETIWSGSRAAIAGGVTTMACFPNTEPAVDNDAAAEFVVLQGKRAGLANVYPVGAVTLGREGLRLAEMGGLARAGAVAFSDADRTIRSAEVMRRGLLYAKMFDLPVISHCEDPDLRGVGVMNYGKVALRLGLPGIPDVAEDIVLARDLLLAEITQGRLHVGHMSTRGSVRLLREAKSKGVAVTGEVTPPHFALTEESLLNYDPNFKLVPPLRTAADAEALVEGLRDGVIDVICSGHAPHSLEEKELGLVYAPPGAVGLESLFCVSYTVLSERYGFPLIRVLEKMTIQPAKILKLAGDRGSLEPGKVADIAVFDVSTERSIHASRFQSKSRNTCFEGFRGKGSAAHVFVGGRAVLRNGEFVEASGTPSAP